ncbi:MAG TPA: PLP-dependent aminotransferase family protein [Solirubrobacteraceae bacterium]|jgi:DNA-binding transcriptional MocR family regulator|nr:PLP-dependent aminotransferase family protein [Solirubrobacteraceae bacterium]
MDQEVAQTLGELERKLHELERTLHAMSAGEPLAEEPPPESQPTPRWSRIVDETIEHSQPPAPAHSQPPAPASERSQPPAGAPWQPRAPLPPPAPQPQPPPSPQPPSAAELLRFRDRLERAARELTHDYDELLGRLSYAAVPTTTGPTISFARGAPSLDIVDVDGLRDAAVRAFESDPAGTTAYGTSVGYPRLRSWIADRHGVEPERVLVTNGSMQADAFLFEQLVRSGDEVIVERPTYDRTLLSLRGRGARVHPVRLQPDGIDTDALAHLLSVEGGAARPTLAHIIPNFQNPAGYTLSLEKRTRLLELAAEHSFVVFEDDPYVELRFSGERLPTMLSMDPERVVYASSFSKTVCPGIRVGYLVGPRELIASIGQLATNTYISPNMVSQSIVYEFCASGAIERSIETVKAALAERAQALANALRSELADAEFVVPQGGYFMWVTLPEGTDVNALYQAAAERGVAFVKGTDFMLEGGENTLRLAYSGVTPEQIDVGIARLAEAYRSL